MKRALIPGTFDPVTIGHLTLIKNAAALFDEVTVCILINPEKSCLFDEETRLSALEIALSGLENVKLMRSHGMTADLAKELDAVIVRGIRNEKDAAYELEMARFNEERNGVKTLFFPAEPSQEEISSTAVRSLLMERKPVPESLLPRKVAELLAEKLLQ